MRFKFIQTISDAVNEMLWRIIIVAGLILIALIAGIILLVKFL